MKVHLLYSVDMFLTSLLTLVLIVSAQEKTVPIKVPQGRNIRLSCQPKIICDQGLIEKYQWIREGEIVGSERDYLINKINLDDAGVYICRLFYRSDGRILKQDMSHVIMVEKIFPESEFALSISQDPPEEIFGDRVVLQAKVTPALTNASYTWMFQGRIVSNRSIHIIKLFQNSDQGIYTCKVIGQSPRTSSNISLTAAIVTKDYKRASFDMQPGSGIVIYVKEKDNLRLRCNRKATEKRSETKWKFLKKTLESSDFLNKRMNRSDNSDVSTLLLSGIEISQEGLYQCEVGNKSLSAIVKITQDENQDNSENTPSSGKDANTIVKPAALKQLDRLNFAIDDQNSILAQIRDHLKEFVNVFKQAPFMKKDSDDLK